VTSKTAKKRLTKLKIKWETGNLAGEENLDGNVIE
jgi:hypothetical protein